MLTNRIRISILFTLPFVLVAIPHTVTQADDNGQGTTVPFTPPGNGSGRSWNDPGHPGTEGTETAEGQGLFSMVDYVQILMRLIP